MQNKGDVIINLQNISFAYPDRPKVFDDLCFKLEHGQKLGLLGANGAGKSTLFHIIMGLIKPDAGQVQVFSKLCQQDSDFAIVRKQIGLLFQNPEDQLFSPTVADDIAFGPLNLRKNPSEVLNIVKETLDIVGLDGYENRVTHRLSGGEKKLVALACVLAMKPEILLLDEPFAGLDKTATKRMTKVIGQYCDTYIIIDHNFNLLKKMTNKLMRLDSGVLLNETI